MSRDISTEMCGGLRVAAQPEAGAVDETPKLHTEASVHGAASLLTTAKEVIAVLRNGMAVARCEPNPASPNCGSLSLLGRGCSYCDVD